MRYNILSLHTQLIYIYVSFVIFLIGSSDSLSTAMFISFFHWFYISSFVCHVCLTKIFISFCCLPLNLKMIYDTIHPIPIDLKCYQCYILIHIYAQISLWTFKNNTSTCSSTTILFLSYFGSYQYYFYVIIIINTIIVIATISWSWLTYFSTQCLILLQTISDLFFQTALWNRYNYYIHVSAKETETYLLSSRTEMKTRVVLTPDLQTEIQSNTFSLLIFKAFFCLFSHDLLLEINLKITLLTL